MTTSSFHRPKADAAVYKKGDPCADCGAGYNCDAAKLCAKAGGGGGSAAGESKAEEGGFSFLSAVGVIGTLLAVGAVIAAVVHMHKAQAAPAAAAAPADAAQPADGAHPPEEGAAGASHEAAAGDVPPGEHKEPGAEPEKSAEVHDAAGASQDALAKK